MSDTREHRVLQAVALHDGEVCDFCQSTTQYTYKGAVPPYTILVHGYDCPVLLARDILCEQGTPVNAYLIQWEEFTKRHMWEVFSYCYVALTEQDAHYHATDNLGYTVFRNLTVKLATQLGEVSNELARHVT